MIALRSPDLLGGVSLVVVGLQQAVAPAIPEPWTNLITALLTGSGVATIVVYFGRRWADNYFTGLATEREAEMTQRDKQHATNEARFLDLTAQVKELSGHRDSLVSEFIAVHREEARFWRDQFLAERDRRTE